MPALSDRAKGNRNEWQESWVILSPGEWEVHVASGNHYHHQRTRVGVRPQDYIIIYYYILLLLLLRVVRSPRYAHKQYAHMHTLLAGRLSRPGRTPRGLFPLRASPDSRPDLVNGLPPILCNLHVVIMAVSGGHSWSITLPQSLSGRPDKPTFAFCLPVGNHTLIPLATQSNT